MTTLTISDEQLFFLLGVQSLVSNAQDQEADVRYALAGTDVWAQVWGDSMESVTLGSIEIRPAEAVPQGTVAIVDMKGSDRDPVEVFEEALAEHQAAVDEHLRNGLDRPFTGSN